MSSEWITPAQVEAFRKEETTAFRVRHSPFFWIDHFGPDFLISLKQAADAESLLGELLPWCETNGVPVNRVFARSLVHQPGEEDKPRLLHGDASLLPATVVTENGLKFEIDFEAGYSTGLFMDQRTNRQKLRHLRPQKILNCFAYTCAFSVAAAQEGASTLSIDLSKRALERGKRNFALNNLELTNHRFLADDVFKVLPRLEKREEKFDVIILDPPTFSRSRQSGVFKVEKDFVKLIDLAIACSAKGAFILLSTNSTRISRAELESFAIPLCEAANRTFSFERTKATPDIPELAASTTTWLRLDAK
ncbi:MAG: class I SAM-dependent methyltransferase [Candidatus Sumerlaeota bacterium]